MKGALILIAMIAGTLVAVAGGAYVTMLCLGIMAAYGYLIGTLVTLVAVLLLGGFST